MDIDRTDEQRLAATLGELPQEIMPDHDLWPGIASRLGRRRSMRSVLLQVAAAIVIFVAGLVAGSVTPRGPATPQSQPHAEVAADIQRQGSEYVAAISALARESDERRRIEGREVALATIYGALFELQRASGEGVPDAMHAVSVRRREASQRAETISLVRF